MSDPDNDFELHSQRGFLPAEDPCAELPAEFQAWEALGRELPKLLVSGTVRAQVDRLPHIHLQHMTSTVHERCAMLLLSFIGHAYVWGQKPVVDRLPAALAVPWHHVARRLGRPPVLSYASYALDNWRRLDPLGPIALGNIVLRQNFLGGIDEEWFILVHVEIEAHAVPALNALKPAQTAAAVQQWSELENHLSTIADALQRMLATLQRMPEHCDPYIYYQRVRPYIHGWKNQPVLPRGLIYDGVTSYGGRPQQFRGETGAQSSIVPALDAALGITHRDDPLRPYLLEMRDYMPPPHRAFIAALEAGPSIRAVVQSASAAHSGLRHAYNTCIRCLAAFRSLHLEYAGRYIHRQSERDPANPTHVGTGGTPFMPYLLKHRDETLGHEIHE